MTYAPGTIASLRTELIRWTGLSPVSLGIVGDAAHAARASYHNGKDRILQYNRLATDYSARTARDRAGLTNAASALDVGNFARLREMSKWLVAEAQTNAPGTSDIREIIYSPDGQVVLRWDRERGYQSAPRTGEADNSHLTHTHISWYRDSEFRTKIGLFARFFEGEDMTVKYTPITNEIGGTVRIDAATNVIPIEGNERIAVAAGPTRPAIGTFTLDDLPERGAQYLMIVGDRIVFIDADVVTFTPTDTVEEPPSSQIFPVTVTIGGKAINGEVELP